MISLQPNDRHEGEWDESEAEDDRLDLERLHSRDEASFNRLYERHKHVVFAVALSMVKHHQDAENVVQETFLQLLKEPPAVQAEFKSIKNWLASVARSKSLNLLRTRKTAGYSRGMGMNGDETVSDAAVNLEDSGVTPLEQFIQKDTALEIRNVVNGLPAHQAEAICARYFEGLKYEEIEERLSIARSTVIQRLQFGREALKMQLHALLSH